MRGGYTLESLRLEIHEMLSINRWIIFEWKDRISQQIHIARRSSHQSKFMIDEQDSLQDLKTQGGYTLESLRLEIHEM
jgi:hypothetical protein